MKICNLMKVLTTCVLMFAFTSCGDDVVYETIKNTDESLCNKTWVMETEENGTVVQQYKLTFYPVSRKGQELTVIYEEDGRLLLIVNSRGSGWMKVGRHWFSLLRQVRKCLRMFGYVNIIFPAS